MNDSREITALREAGISAQVAEDSIGTYAMQVSQLKGLHAGMNNTIMAIEKDGTLTKDGKIFETAEYMDAFSKETSTVLDRIQHEVDSRIKHHTDRLFTNNPVLSDVEKAMIPMVSEMALKEPSKAMTVQSRANVVNAMLHMGLYSKAMAKSVYEGLNVRYTPQDSKDLGTWQNRNDNLQKIKVQLKNYVTVNSYSKKEVERVKANKLSGSGNRHKRVS